MIHIVALMRRAVPALALALTLALNPMVALASDISDLAEHYGLPAPTLIVPRARTRSSTIFDAQPGQWEEFSREEGIGMVQVNDFFIAEQPTSDGSISVTVRTTIYNTGLNYVMWTTSKDIYCDGTWVAGIKPSYDEAGMGGSITQSATFFLSESGVHRITSTETEFRGGTQTKAGWDFEVKVPFAIAVGDSEGGSISPSASLYADPGSTHTFAITPDEGYRIDAVLVDGEDVGSVSSYTFTDIKGDHRIEATFRKVWSVVFLDGDGNEIARETVDDGTSVDAPAIPDRDGYTSCGWDADLGCVTADLIVSPVYEPIITVRVPAIVPCTILPSGEVVAPDGYAIENDSCVDVTAVSIEAVEQEADTTISLHDGDTIVFSTAGGGSGLSIGAKDSKELTWQIDPLDAAKHADLIAAATQSEQRLGLIRFTFEALS